MASPAASFSERESPDELEGDARGVSVSTAAQTVYSDDGGDGLVPSVGYAETLKACVAKKERCSRTGIMHRLYSTVGRSHVWFTANVYNPVWLKMNGYVYAQLYTVSALRLVPDVGREHTRTEGRRGLVLSLSFAGRACRLMGRRRSVGEQCVEVS